MAQVKEKPQLEPQIPRRVTPVAKAYSNVVEQRLPISVDAYLALSELGHVPENSELIEGDIFELTAHSSRHRAMVKILDKNFGRFLEDKKSHRLLAEHACIRGLEPRT